MADKSLILKAGRFFGAAHRALYRATKGKWVGKLGQAPVLLLTTTGRKSGKARTVPVLYLEDGENLVVIASAAGHDQHPAWFLNLTSNPEVEVEIGGDKQRRRARVAEGEERTRIWERAVAMHSDFANYQQSTERVIPVVALERA